MAKVFLHRWVVLIEKTYIVKEPHFTARSYPTYNDASHAASKAEKRHGVYASVVDTVRYTIAENWVVEAKKIA